MTAATMAKIGHSTHQPHGWLASMLVHVLAIAVSVLLFAELKPASQQDPFRWEIALAQVAPSPQVEPPTPVPPQPKAAVQPPPPAPPKPIEHKPVVKRTQTVQPIQQSVQKVEQVVRREEVATQKVNPVVESLAKHAEPVQQERQQVKTVEATQRIEAVETPVATVTTPTPVSQPTPVTERVQTEQVVQQEPAPVVSEVTAQRPSPVTTAEPVVAQTPAPVEQPAVNHSTHQAVEAPAPVQQTAREAAPEAVEQPAPVQHTARAMAPQPQVMERPAGVTAQKKADFSWLTQELISRLERSKRYPYVARMNRWEGRVVVRAVVRDDGQVVGLQIAESSGHAILDNDAMELIRKIAPLHLKHPLGQSQVALLVPVGYALQ